MGKLSLLNNNNGSIHRQQDRRNGLKIEEGALLTIAEKGAFEFVAGVLYFSTANGTRKTVTLS